MSENKHIMHLHEGITKRDNAKFIRGHVVAYVKGTDTVLFEKDNKVILPGSTFTALKHFKDLNVEIMTPTYNSKLDLDNTTSVPIGVDKTDNYIYLFAVGIGGCGPEASQVIDVDYTKWISPEEIIPFRYCDVSNDLGAGTDADKYKELRAKYFGRSTRPGGKVAYYFKAFDGVQFKQQYLDGNSIEANVYDSDKSVEVETFVEIKMSISNKDCREIFAATTGLNDARVNTISLLEAVETEIDGFKYYQNIRPVTKLNFPTEALVDETKGIDIVYSLFY